MSPVYLCITYKNNARLLDDNASGEYDRYFESQDKLQQYVQTLGRHAEAKPYMSVKAIVVDAHTYEHINCFCWNWR